eukprot:3821953-Rhodomonas_salina.2
MVALPAMPTEAVSLCGMPLGPTGRLVGRLYEIQGLVGCERSVRRSSGPPPQAGGAQPRAVFTLLDREVVNVRFPRSSACQCQAAFL